jgi:hypothetical protein
MSPAVRAASNASAATLAWLRRELGLDADETASEALRLWCEVSDAMRRAPGGQFLDNDYWPSDPWIARSSRHTFIGKVVPVWAPPERLDEWPTLDVRAAIASVESMATRTNHHAFWQSCTDVEPASGSESGTAFARLAEMEAEVREFADLRVTQIEQVRAWLDTALGSMFLDIPIAEIDTPGGRTALARARLAQARALNTPTPLMEFEDRRIEVIYCSRVAGSGSRVTIQSLLAQTGQCQWWREHWWYLSRDLDSYGMFEALQVAAGLLCCPSLLGVLREALSSGDTSLAKVSLAVLRRWLLTLKTMAWLETALARPWVDVRPTDLACFAFNAVKPEWPRRVLAISHRSGDAKPTLRGMELWGSSRCAIDATYVPVWETNTAMVWALFAATPGIARVRSSTYEASEWCRREIELTQYLIENSDFLDERWVLDVPLLQLQDLDGATTNFDREASEETPAKPPTARGRMKNLDGGEFPPSVGVWPVPILPAWEASMLRAGAAVRLINCIAPSPDLANRLATLLIQGGDRLVGLPLTPPTNNPKGWLDYSEILRAASSSETRELAARLPPTYNPREKGRDRNDVQAFPDLSSGVPALRDVLLAVEWLRIEFPFMVTRGLGARLLIDCRGLSRQQWESQDDLSLQRGLLGLRQLPAPLWKLQIAGQEVESWPLMGVRPIFTEHVQSQFMWMAFENAVDRAEAQRRYPEASGLMLSETLLRRCLG